MNYAYIRVSTQDQNEERQLIAMHDHGIGDAHFFIDKQSGKDFDRPHYQRMLKRLKPGDVLFVKSILMLVIRFTIDGTVARKM
ncbi:MAG: recombinase family protein, partial [Clostridia bacterium]|nr:recombinase family protein [Clostridia bacterium]